ncbi:MAG TPA: hypothetical protein VFE62_02485, partial [Gemmataceae bacterium]|nr:hypothetical protein [Gemmataceae bacterium]
MKRALTIAAIAVVGLLFIGWLGLRAYLHSSSIVNHVSSQVADLSGERVTIDDVDIGITSSTLRGVHFFEPGDDEQPWLTIDSVTVHAPLWRMDKGNLAHATVNVEGMQVLARFDSAGDLLTRFPKHKATTPFRTEQLPEIVIEKSTVTLRKEKYGDIVVGELRGRTTAAHEGLVFEGTAENQAGPLTIHASLNVVSQLANIKLATRGAHVDRSLLERIPWVPVAVFRELQVPHGDADAQLDVHYDLKSGDLHYRTEIDARNADLYLPAVALAIHQGAGKIIVEDYTARLPDFAGTAVGGKVRGQGTVVYQPTGTYISLTHVVATDMRAEDVPQSWGIPAPVRRSIAGGRLDIKGSLELTVRDSGTVTHAATALTGAANPTCGSWLDSLVLAAALPQESLTIETKGKGQIHDPAGKEPPIDFNWQLAPPTAEEKQTTSALNDPRGVFVSFPPMAFQDAKPKPAPRYFDFQFNLKNASLAELAKNEGVNLPIPLAGKLSVHVKASLPLDRLNELGVYKASGTASIEQFRLGGLSLDEVKSDFHLADGLLYLDSLKSSLGADANKKAGGALTGSGRVQLAPLGPLHADLSFEQISLQRIAQQKADRVRGTVSGSITVDADASKLKDAKDVQARGKIAGNDVAVYGIALEDLAASFVVKDGAVEFPELRTRIEGVEVKPTAALQLQTDGAFQGKLTLRNLDVEAIRKIAAARKVSLPAVAGTLSAEVALQGNKDPSKLIIRGNIASPKLTFDKLQAHDVVVPWKLDKETVSISDASASVYDGKVAGSATIPIDGNAPTTFDLTVADVNARSVVADLRMPISVDGKASGKLHGAIAPATPKMPAKADFDVDLQSDRMRVQNIPAEQIKG